MNGVAKTCAVARKQQRGNSVTTTPAAGCANAACALFSWHRGARGHQEGETCSILSSAALRQNMAATRP